MRKPRVLEKLARYHVTARVNNKEFFIESNRAKALFVEVLLRAKQRYSFKIENFVIMGNHFHLIIQPAENESLSRIMQWILSVYAMAYNRITGRCGHFWGDRFFSRVLYSLAQYLMVFKYIDDNPLSANIYTNSEWQYCGSFHRRHGLLYLIDKLPFLINLVVQNTTQLLLG